MERQPRRLEREGRADVAASLASYRAQLLAAGLSDAEVDRLLQRRSAELDAALATMLAAARRRFDDHDDARDH